MPQEEKLKILFFGDLVGRPGRLGVQRFLTEKLAEYSPDFVIANIENASHGFGLTEKNYTEISSYGVDCMTSGNHIWDKKDIFDYIDGADRLLRPINYYNFAPGIGSKVFEKNGVKIGVINALGKVFMDSPVSAWVLIDDEIKKLKKETPIVVIDFHAEATAEKICLGKFAKDFGIRGVFGTHTHVQSADEKIIEKECAYITDTGFCGASEGVIGMEYEGSVKHIITGIPQRFEVLKDPKIVQINALEVIYKKNLPKSIKRINETFEVNYES